MKIANENVMALMIDFQEKLVPAIHENEKLIETTVKLLNGLNQFQCPIVFTQQYTKGLGMTVAPLMETQENFQYFDKTTFSCLDTDEILGEVEGSEKTTFIIAGMETHICVMQTVLDLLDRGFKVYVVADCVGSRTEFNRQIGLDRMKQEGAIITSMESILFELAKKAGTPEFKAVSKIIK